jgi:uncharacterized membrane protein (UPF0127 family)
MVYSDSYKSTALLFLATVASLLFIGCNGSDSRNQTDVPAEERSLTYETQVAFLSSSGDTLSVIDAAVADDQESRTQGLMNVQSMPQDAGMIFIFDENQPRSFWMASTPLSLDLIFANEEFEIVRIHRNAAPYSQDSIASGAPAKYVVEVNAGYTVQYDINEGGSILLLD